MKWPTFPEGRLLGRTRFAFRPGEGNWLFDVLMKSFAGSAELITDMTLVARHGNSIC
jgi:hypothetical protein